MSESRREEPSPPVPPFGAAKQGEEDLWLRHRAERGVWSEKMLLALERGVKGNQWFSLIDKVYGERTLEKAWEKVRANAGGCGVDGITVRRFAEDSRKGLLALKEQLSEGRYVPHAIKRVWIPKEGSPQMRPLGIPAVRDRVVQTALRMVIEPVFEREFAPQSYGFRPGRSCQDALRRVEELLREGRLHVVDVDIAGCFDHIPHGRLMERVAERIADGRVLGLVEAFLKQGVLEASPGSADHVEAQQSEEGTPQGAVISPLLANIYLNPLDWLMKQSGLEMVRYADDMVVLCRSAEEAAGALERIAVWMKEAGLSLHAEKTRIADLSQAGGHFDFLGYRFWRSRRGKLSRFVRPKSLKRIREKLRALTRRNNPKSMEENVKRLNGVLRGWYRYFRHASAHSLKEVEQWLRGRLRSMLRKRHRRKGRARRPDHQRWPNCCFERLGLLSLTQARAAEINSLRIGATC